jgi:RimJ/RimL family protein N-acetyltransferase
MKVQVIKFNNITLRPMSVNDAPSFRKWFGDKEVVKYLIRQKPSSQKESLKWIQDEIKSKVNYVWAILDENKELIGNTRLKYDKKNKVGNLGIVIGEKRSWGKGYSYDALMLVIDFAFKKLKCNRLELMVYSDNERAKKLYKKLGFVFEGRQRQKLYNSITKKFEDDEIYSILRQEYKK